MADPAPILVMAALEQELAPLRKALADLGSRVRLAKSGVGPRRAAAAARRHAPGCRLLLNTGCCGGLVPGASGGMLVVPRRLASWDGASAGPAAQPDEGWVSTLLSTAERLGHHCSDRPLVTSDRALNTPESKREVHRLTGAVAVDMESAAVAGAAAELGVPTLVVRVILDTVDETLPEPAVTDDSGRVRPLKLARAMLKPRAFLGRAGMAVRLRGISGIAAGLIRSFLLEELGGD